MRIGIDARFWGTRTGIGRYVPELFKEILKKSADEFVLFLRKENWEAPPPDRRVKKVLADARWYTLKEQLLAPIFDRERCDFIHFPHWNVPIFLRTPFVLTIHDLLLLDFPSKRATLLGPVRYAVKYAGYKVVLSRALRRARAIIAPSKFTKERLKVLFPREAEKINVIYEGVSELSACSGIGSLAAKGVAPPYLLYVGNAYPHKNLEALIETAGQLRLERPGLALVLVGKDDDFYQRLKKKYAREPFVVFYGEATDEELDCLYREAAAYVFPSLQEGFGLPGLEAAARRVPVVAARSGSLPEVYGEAAIYFDPRDGAGMKSAILRILDDQNLRARQIQLGLRGAAKFRWDDAAEKTLRVYHSAAVKK